ncbi:MAG: hypothetical protein H6915_07970 [Novosphingobium sp.]|nr:hypothetical protein [Novosphingobium sp.]MCP5389690.1 hypothetical protein [Novosphingobium sp.]
MRIQAALSRAETAGRKCATRLALGPNPTLLRQHQALKNSVSTSLAELDRLIEGLED